MPRENAGAVTWLDSLESFLNYGLMLAVAAVVVISGYYVYGTLGASAQLFGGMGDNGQPLTADSFQHNMANMQLLMKILLLAATVLTICAIGRFYGSPETGVALVLVGALFFFGMPFLFSNFGGTVGKLPAVLRKLELPDPLPYLKNRYQLAGIITAGAGVLQLLIHAFLFVVSSRSRRPKANADAAKTAQQVRKPNDKYLGSCWNLPFCRDTEKKLCPIRHSKKSCWRSGRGCYCDQNVILTLSGGNAYAASRGSAGYMSAAATVARPKTLREKREQCLQCPVYLHRQGQKYKALAPGSLLVVVGVVYYFWEPIRTAWPNFMTSFGTAVTNFSFTHTSSTAAAPEWTKQAGENAIVMYLLIFVAIALLVSYLLHAVEWLLYRLGI